MKTKNLFLTALAAIALVSCADSEFIGETSPEFTSQGTDGAIVFGSNSGSFTRATSNTGTVAQMLDGHFKFYGVKNVSGYTDVFQNYAAWNATTKTTSNPDGAEADADNTTRMNGWEYVGDGSAKGGLANQTIKYWDYSATDYHFAAGSPYGSFTYNIVSGDIASATVTGIKGHIAKNNGTPGTTTGYNPVYIADPVKVVKANYQQEVVFSFTRQQSLVRVGFYETVPGYSITDIKFYKWDVSTGDWYATPSNNITLSSKTSNYFQGAANATATVTYNWTTPNYTFAYDPSTLIQSNNWYGGQLTSGVPAKTSTEATMANLYGTDKDMAAADGYFTVLPSPSALVAQPILIKCDYTLTADDGKGETIKVSGATAAIPATFCKWKQNTSYTYLFKISDNTNGSTGVVGTDPEGLFPITFDAVVIAEEDAMKEGIITTVSTPSITTYQEGSVTAEGVEYKKGSAIYFTAQNDETGELYSLQESAGVGYVKVYSLGTTPKTEADMQITPPTTGDVTTFVISSNKTYGTFTLTGNKHAKFTPSAAGYYAIRYQTVADPATYAYKIVKVVE